MFSRHTSRWPVALLTATLVALGLPSACGHTRPDSTTTAPRDSLFARLQTEVGQGRSVAILAGPSGLRAIASDGSRTRHLTHEATGWVVVDNRSRVLWFSNEAKDTLFAIDLEAPAVKVETIATGLPLYDGPYGDAGFDVMYPDEAPEIKSDARWDHGLEVGLTPNRMVAHFELRLGAEPSLVGAPSFLDMQDEENEWVTACAGIAVTNMAFLKAISERPNRLGPVPPRPPTREVTTALHAYACSDQSVDCGTAEEVVGTRWWRVIVDGACNDGCYRDWRVYDPKTREFPAGEWAALRNAWVAPDGKAWVSLGTLWRPEIGAVNDDGDCDCGGGWLGGGLYYGL